MTVSELNLTACETCGETILVCDNDVWLDWPGRPYDAELAPWILMIVGDIAIAQTFEDAHASGFEGYALHLHQPL